MTSIKETGRSVQPPYVSRTVLNAFFEKMKHASRPKVLSPAALKEYNLSEVWALHSALKFLGLIDDKGNTTDGFSRIQVTGESFQENLKGLVRAAYKDLLEKHPLDHATYDDILNYFAQKYSAGTKYKMAKAFGSLCQMSGLESPAFRKMRSMGGKESSKNNAASANRVAGKPKGRNPALPPKTPPSNFEDLVMEYIKTNPMPTGAQWDVEALKIYFEEYRKTINMLRGTKDKQEGE